MKKKGNGSSTVGRAADYTLVTANNFHEDFERESLKDYVYLLEARMLEEQEYRKWIADQNRKPAKIEIVGELPKLKTDELEYNTLPF